MWRVLFLILVFGVFVFFIVVFLSCEVRILVFFGDYLEFSEGVT